jgi:hypothetical protein
MNKVGRKDVFQVGVLGEGGHIVGSIYRLLKGLRSGGQGGCVRWYYWQLVDI